MLWSILRNKYAHSPLLIEMSQCWFRVQHVGLIAVFYVVWWVNLKLLDGDSNSKRAQLRELCYSTSITDCPESDFDFESEFKLGHGRGQQGQNAHCADDRRLSLRHSG